MNELLKRLTGHRLFWPIAILALLLITSAIVSDDFFSITIREGALYGPLINILRYGAVLMLVAVGMTLVIATSGIDLSVGAVVAVSGALACFWISRLDDQNSVGGVLTAVALALGLSVVLGAWNGFLVAGVGIQPIVATLILLVAGRGLAQLITEGQIITVNSAPYATIGTGYLFAFPVSVIIAAAVTALAMLLTRRTALGMLIEAVGGNAEASRLAGIRARRIKVLVYTFSGFCAGVAGLIYSSNVRGADGNNAGLFIELDAILAVVIGGTSLAGGRFTLSGTVVGVLMIQSLTTSIYAMGVPPETSMLFKALVVTAVCLIQSPAFRAKVFGGRRWAARTPRAGEPPGPGAREPGHRVEVRA
ncbi:MAG TPA: ABC transporter permease [Micromonosporaceae bacterium]|nr:ABC transporter permease [Micromonosporaceae bacterium]